MNYKPIMTSQIKYLDYHKAAMLLEGFNIDRNVECIYNPKRGHVFIYNASESNKCKDYKVVGYQWLNKVVRKSAPLNNLIIY